MEAIGYIINWHSKYGTCKRFDILASELQTVTHFKCSVTRPLWLKPDCNSETDHNILWYETQNSMPSVWNLFTVLRLLMALYGIIVRSILLFEFCFIGNVWINLLTLSKKMNESFQDGSRSCLHFGVLIFFFLFLHNFIYYCCCLITNKVT